MVIKKGSSSVSTKEAFARHLQSADLLAKQGKFEEALAEIQKALQIDPQNYYARSFQDRVRAEAQRRQQKIEEKEKQGAIEDERKLETISEYLHNAEQFISTKDFAAALKEVAKVFKIDPQNYFAISYSDRIEILMGEEEEKKKSVSPEVGAASTPLVPPKVVPAEVVQPATSAGKESPSTKPVPTQAPTPPPLEPAPADAGEEKTERASLIMYRQMLKEMWFDGKVTAAESQELEKVRQMFNITIQEHEEAEKQVHLEAYVNALKTAWRDGVISQTENEVLQLMRQRFNISAEEHKAAENQILWAQKNNALSKGTILIAEDDRAVLLYLGTALKKHGYVPVTAESVDKAVKLLEQTSPQLILSDLMFAAGQKSGLEFYQQVRNNPKFRNLPFLLMSAIDDEFVVRAGVRMGVDEFLKKPFSIELLLATIEGKIKKASPTP